MLLDLNKDAAEFYSYVVARATNYTPTSDAGLGGEGPIQMIYAGYEFDQSGWCVLVFDRRTNAQHDGEWTRYIDDHIFRRPHWVKAGVLGGKNFSASLGQILVGTLQRAERDGVFSELPLASGYRIGLEEFNGSFSWDSTNEPNGRSPRETP